MTAKEYKTSPKTRITQPLGQTPTRTHTRVFRVELDVATDGTQAVRDEVGIAIGDTYSYEGETDDGAICTDIDVKRLNSSPNVWEATYTYKAESPGGGGDGKKDEGQPGEDNTFLVDQKVQWSQDTIQRAAVEDKNGIAVKNAAGDQFDPPVMFNVNRTRLIISRNEPRFGNGRFNNAVIDAYVNKLNQAAFWGFAAKTVLCDGISATQTTVQNNDAWRVTYSFVIDLTDIGHKAEVLEHGANCLDGAGGKKIKCIDEFGHPIEDRLAADGTQLATAAADVFASFDMYFEADFNNLNFDTEQGGVGI